MIKKSINIAVLTNMYPSSESAPWLGIFVKEQVDSLHDVFKGNIHLFHIKGRITPGGNNLNYLIWIIKYPFLAIFNNLKLVHSHHFLCTFIACLYPFAKIVYTVHEGELLAGGFRSFLIKLSIKLADHVIFVNNEMFKLFHMKNSSFLPSGINIKQFAPIAKEIARKKLSLDSESVYIFFPASPERLEKNAKFIKNFLVKEKSFVEKNNIEVIWGGSIQYEEMPIYMSAADILVSFSDYESDGMVFKEAMACNLPVITFDIGNAQIYFGDEKAGSIVGKDYEVLKNKILFWINNKSQGRSKIIGLGMSSKNVSDELLKIYNKVLLPK